MEESSSRQNKAILASTLHDTVAENENIASETSVKRRKKSSFDLLRLFLSFRAAHIVTVEPVVFLFMFGIYLLLFTYQQYFFWRYAMHELAGTNFTGPHDSSTFCISADDLKRHGQSVVNVQKSSSHLISYVSLPGQVTCIIAAMIFGPLSDKLGRKFIFLSVGVGVVIEGLFVLTVIVYDLDMYILIASGFISGVFGGFAALLAASFAYAADVSSPGRCRSIRIGLIGTMIFTAGVVSEGGAGKLLQYLNCTFWPLIVLYISSGVLIILYTTLYLPEPLSRSERLQRTSNHPKGVRNLLRGLKLFFCPSTYSTWKLWAALCVLIVIIGNTVGVQMITAIFQQGDPLKWGPSMIGDYAMIEMVTHGVGTLVVLPILILLSVPDVVIALIGVLFSGSMNLFTGNVKRDWQMFLVALVSGMEAVIPPSIRSFMSKLVSPEDQGALFACITSTEVLAAVAATAFYPNIFSVLLNDDLKPGTVFFIMATLCIIPIPILLTLWIATRHTHDWLCCREPAARHKAETVTSKVEEKNKEEDDDGDNSGDDEKEALLQNNEQHHSVQTKSKQS